MDELESLRKQLGMAKNVLPYLEIPAAGYTDNTRPAYLSLEIENQRKKISDIENQIAELESKTNTTAETKTTATTSSQPIPFTNRDDDVRDLRSSGAQPYVLIDAPAGYGKTTLLKRLNTLFKEDGWLSAYVAVTKYTTLPEIIVQLANELEVTATLNVYLPWIKRLGSALTQLFNESQAASEQQPQKKVILLIDFDKYPVRELVKEVVDELIPITKGYLGTMNSPISFRVIIAGRYLGTLKEAKTDKLRFLKRSLKPFSYDVIQTSVKEFTNRNDAVVGQLAAHLLYLTGGHPDYIAQALRIYDGSPPDMFFQSFSKSISNITVDNASNVLNGLPEQFSDLTPIILDYLNVFRYFDKQVLTHILREATCKVPERRNLEDRLVFTYLFTRSKGIIYDDIVRRVLAIRLCWANPGMFSDLCRRARDIYAHRMQEDTRSPEKWAIEYLFQSLQQYAYNTHEVSERNKLRQSFFRRRGGDIDNMLILLTKSQKDISEMKDFLIEELNKDWEFQFTINYYLRDTQYTEQPYNDLITTIERFRKPRT